MWKVGYSDKTIQLFKKLDTKRLENEMSGIINPSFNGLIYNTSGHFDFQFLTSKSSSKNFFKCTTFKLLNFTTLHIFLVKNDLHEAQIVALYYYGTLFLSKWKHIQSWLMLVSTNLVHINTNYCYCSHKKCLYGWLYLSPSS